MQQSRALLADVRAKLPPKAASSGTVGQGTLSELRALGYLGPADAGSSTTVPEPSLLPDPKDKIEEQNLLHRAMLASDAGETAQARVQQYLAALRAQAKIVDRRKELYRPTASSES